MGDVQMDAEEPIRYLPPRSAPTISPTPPPPSTKRRRLHASAVTEDMLREAEQHGTTLLQWTKKGDKVDATFSRPPGVARSMGIAETRDELSSLLGCLSQIREALEKDIEQQAGLAN